MNSTLKDNGLLIIRGRLEAAYKASRLRKIMKGSEKMFNELYGDELN